MGGPVTRGLILFDIDGTLLRGGDPDHALAFLHAMREVYGREPSLEGISPAGMLDSQIARLALSRQGLAEAEINARLSEMVALMGERYAEAVARRSRIERLLPGVVEVLERLRAEPYVLGVLTGNARAVAESKLGAAGIRHYFDVGAFGDSALDRWHLVTDAQRSAEERYQVTFPGNRIVLVGDTPRDIEAARQSGSRVLAVATGRFSMDELAEHAPDALLPDMGDTETVVATIDEIVGT